MLVEVSVFTTLTGFGVVKETLGTHVSSQAACVTLNVAEQAPLVDPLTPISVSTNDLEDPDVLVSQLLGKEIIYLFPLTETVALSPVKAELVTVALLIVKVE